MSTLDLARKIVHVLEDKKGEDILLLDLQGHVFFADYFIICSGTSERMLRGLVDALVEDIKATEYQKPRLEGAPEDGWMLADFGDIIVHIFSVERRNYYRLEDLWSQAKILIHLQ